jgi:hypothetical protein
MTQTDVTNVVEDCRRPAVAVAANRSCQGDGVCRRPTAAVAEHGNDVDDEVGSVSICAAGVLLGGRHGALSSSSLRCESPADVLPLSIDESIVLTSACSTLPSEAADADTAAGCGLPSNDADVTEEPTTAATGAGDGVRL